MQRALLGSSSGGHRWWRAKKARPRRAAVIGAHIHPAQVQLLPPAHNHGRACSPTWVVRAATAAVVGLPTHTPHMCGGGCTGRSRRPVPETTQPQRHPTVPRPHPTTPMNRALPSPWGHAARAPGLAQPKRGTPSRCCRRCSGTLRRQWCRCPACPRPCGRRCPPAGSQSAPARARRCRHDTRTHTDPGPPACGSSAAEPAAHPRTAPARGGGAPRRQASQLGGGRSTGGGEGATGSTASAGRGCVWAWARLGRAWCSWRGGGGGVAVAVGVGRVWGARGGVAGGGGAGCGDSRFRTAHPLHRRCPGSGTHFPRPCHGSRTRSRLSQSRPSCEGTTEEGRGFRYACCKCMRVSLFFLGGGGGGR
jgi:hypothetical protein